MLMLDILLRSLYSYASVFVIIFLLLIKISENYALNFTPVACVVCMMRKKHTQVVVLYLSTILACY